MKKVYIIGIGMNGKTRTRSASGVFGQKVSFFYRKSFLPVKQTGNDRWFWGYHVHIHDKSKKMCPCGSKKGDDSAVEIR